MKSLTQQARKGIASFAILLLLAAPLASADIPAVLTDKIHKGSGVIDILKNVTSQQLSSYLNNYQALYLGVDLNEHSSGSESAKSQGVAISQMRLLLSTTAGDFSFSDFVTSTQAQILNASGERGGILHALRASAKKQFSQRHKRL